jgi:chemotaxis protein CheD
MMAGASNALPQVHLAAGHLVITREPQIVVTVLGSCVAVTMFERTSGMAAICHAMLAQPRPSEVVGAGDPGRFRFVSHAVPSMIAAFRRAGVNRRAIEVKLFGGGNVIGPPAQEFAGSGVGAVNVAAAREILEAAELIVSAESSGGRHGRKILFNTATGEVLHKRLRQIIR